MQTLYDLIKTQEEAYKLPITVSENYEWSMFSHITTTVNYKSSKYTSGSEDRPFKNIIRPILNLQYRAEGFDVKDILIYVEDTANYFKSFLLRKFHERWAREEGLDYFIDELVESYVDFGGALVKKVKGARPEVVQWQSIAFCDQTDFLSGPFAIKHQYSPEQLREVGKGKWKSEEIERVIALAETKKEKANHQDVQTPGKYIEVYEVHGCFPASYLEKYDYKEKEKEEYFNQLHIVTFYRDEKDEKKGISLFSAPERKLPFKLLLRDKVFGRALGIGGAEELFEPQVWVNYGAIRIKDLLDAASKIVFKTNDPAFANRNKISNMQNLEIAVIDDGKDISQIDTRPVNIGLFSQPMQDWEANARTMGAATESILGEAPSSGTPFKLQELITAESHSLHEYRKKKIADFVDEIYNDKDWIMDELVREVLLGDEFLTELDGDEMQFVADKIADKLAQDAIRESIMNGILLTNELLEDIKANVKRKFFEGGNKRFVKILKDEFKNAPISVKVNIAGKQKDIAGKVDKLTNVFRFVFSSFNPQTGQFAVLQDPTMSKIFRRILELSGLEQVDFNLPAPSAPQEKVPIEANRSLSKLGERSLAEQVSNK